MHTPFQILAAVLLGVAAYYLLVRDDSEIAFVTGVLGVCSYFLSLRVQMKRRIDERAADDLDHGEIDEQGREAE
ncbi:MAG: hypothetical protein ACK4S4_07400 [Pyrinomonadaceae bacterium]